MKLELQLRLFTTNTEHSCRCSRPFSPAQRPNNGYSLAETGSRIRPLPRELQWDRCVTIWQAANVTKIKTPLYLTLRKNGTMRKELCLVSIQATMNKEHFLGLEHNLA